MIAPVLSVVRRFPVGDRAADMAGDRLHRILAELSAGGDGWSSARLCGGCVKITGVNGAGVMLMSGDIPRGSLCTTNAVSHLIEELQYTLGEGPCVDAYQRDRVVAEPDLADPATRRWVAFTPPALQAGVRAVFGFPLRVGTVRLGALNLYRDRSGPLTDGQHADALVLADVAARWMLEAQAGAPRAWLPRNWRPAPTSTSRCTTRQASSRSSSRSASPRRSSGCGPTPSAATACSPMSPRTSSPAGPGCNEPRFLARRRGNRRLLGWIAGPRRGTHAGRPGRLAGLRR